MRHRAKFLAGQSKLSKDATVFAFQYGGRPPSWIYKVTSGQIRRFNMRHRTKFHEDWSNRFGDMADFRFFKMAAVRHLRLVLRVLGPPTKSTWWSL